MAVHLVGIIPISLIGTVWLVILDVSYKCQYSGNSVLDQKRELIR